MTFKHTMRACYLTFISQAIINNLAPLLFVIFQDEFQISLQKIGLLIMINFGTQLIVDALSIRYADKIGYRPLIVVAHILSTIGLICMSILPNILPTPFVGLVISVITYAIGGGLMEVLASPIVEALPGDAKSASMSILHSYYCWGHVGVVLITTALLLLLGTNAWAILPILWSIVPTYNAVNFLLVPMPSTLPENERMPLKNLISSRLFLLVVLLMMCSGASEQAMSQWASLFAEKGLNVSKVMGDLLGPCLFAALMGLGRVLYGIFSTKLRLTRSLACCAILCIACYLVASLSRNPLLALIGCAVTGFSVSLMWPGMLSLSARCFAGGGTAMFSILALGGDVGCAFGPWVTGLVSDIALESERLISLGAEAGLTAIQTGLKSGLFVALVFPLVLLLGVLQIQRRIRKRGFE